MFIRSSKYVTFLEMQQYVTALMPSLSRSIRQCSMILKDQASVHNHCELRRIRENLEWFNR